MLELLVGSKDGFDEKNEKFVVTGGVPVKFEHSLTSISKWESKYERPFISEKDKTDEEVLDYFAMMIVDDTAPEILDQLTQKNVEDVVTYMNAKQTATWFSESGKKKSNETITSELIYFWMASLNIPLECQHWHINRLFVLIRIFDLKSTDGKKKKPEEIDMRKRAELNEQRKREMGWED